MSTPLVDLSDGHSFKEGFPHEFFSWLRREAPIYWHEPTERTPEGEGFWVVSRHAETMAVLCDPETYSSHTGGDRPFGGTAIKDEPGSGRVLNMMDDPRHRRVRGLVNQGFTPRMIARLEEQASDGKCELTAGRSERGREQAATEGEGGDVVRHDRGVGDPPGDEEADVPIEMAGDDAVNGLATILEQRPSDLAPPRCAACVASPTLSDVPGRDILAVHQLAEVVIPSRLE